MKRISNFYQMILEHSQLSTLSVVAILLGIFMSGCDTPPKYSFMMPHPYEEVCLGMTLNEFETKYENEIYSLDNGRDEISIYTAKSHYFRLIELEFNEYDNELKIDDIKFHPRKDISYKEMIQYLKENGIELVESKKYHDRLWFGYNSGDKFGKYRLYLNKGSRRYRFSLRIKLEE